LFFCEVAAGRVLGFGEAKPSRLVSRQAHALQPRDEKRRHNTTVSCRKTVYRLSDSFSATMKTENSFLRENLMMEKTVIRKNLVHIRDYYRLLKRLRKTESIVLTDGEQKLIADYDAAMVDAPLLIRMVYLQMYHEGMTQKEVASLLDLSERQIQRYHADMCERLQGIG
jgi:hypothetical protein